MKKGCLLLLFVLFASAGGYWYLLRGTSLHDQYWLPGVLGLFAAMLLGNFQGMLLALQQKRIGTKTPDQFQDGDYVAVSGNIQALRTPLTAPFSGVPACIVEYDVKSNSEGAASDYSGFLMTPSVIQSLRGSVRIVGFPMLAEIEDNDYSDTASFKRAGEYLAACKFEERATNPFKVLGQINSVLKDDDGTVKADFAGKSCKLHLDTPDDAADYADEDDVKEEEGSTPAVINETPKIETLPEKIARRLAYGGYFLEETVVKHGAEVTVFGTYRKAKQAVDIGSGLENIKHSLKLGSLASATGTMFRRSLITFIVVGIIFGAANWYLFTEVIQLDSLLAK